MTIWYSFSKIYNLLSIYVMFFFFYLLTHLKPIFRNSWLILVVFQYNMFGTMFLMICSGHVKNASEKSHGHYIRNTLHIKPNSEHIVVAEQILVIGYLYDIILDTLVCSNVSDEQLNTWTHNKFSNCMFDHLRCCP